MLTEIQGNRWTHSERIDKLLHQQWTHSIGLRCAEDCTSQCIKPRQVNLFWRITVFWIQQRIPTMFCHFLIFFFHREINMAIIISTKQHRCLSNHGDLYYLSIFLRWTAIIAINFFLQSGKIISSNWRKIFFKNINTFHKKKSEKIRKRAFE